MAADVVQQLLDIERIALRAAGDKLDECLAKAPRRRGAAPASSGSAGATSASSSSARVELGEVGQALDAERARRPGGRSICEHHEQRAAPPPRARAPRGGRATARRASGSPRGRSRRADRDVRARKSIREQTLERRLAQLRVERSRSARCPGSAVPRPGEQRHSRRQARIDRGQLGLHRSCADRSRARRPGGRTACARSPRQTK